jgi:DegV family protein with EDD domain
MSIRPTVLLIAPQAERLREIGRELAAQGYEVVPVADPNRAQRFAQGLGSAVVVVDPAVLDPKGLLAEGRTVVILGQHPEDEEGLPDEFSFLAAAGLEASELARRLLLVLLGRELGVEPDSRLSSLVGDLAQTPLIELLRGLNTAAVSGRLDLRGGSLLVDRGQVAAAVAGPARALKAFCRLGRLHEGPFRFVPGEFPARREIEEDLDALVLAAIEDSLGEYPDPRGQLEVEIGPSFFATPFSPLQQRILGSAQRGATLRQILDGLSDRDGEIVQEVLGLEEKGFLVRREPRVQVVTDSTSDLPPDVAGAHGIAVVPLTVAFGKEVYRDRVDLQPGRFYAMLKEKKAHPASSPPPGEEFARRYGEWVGKGHEVVSIHISSRMSKTAENAKASAPEGVSVVDSGQVSLGLGLLALFAARMAARNEPAGEIQWRLLAMTPRIHTLFVVDTLEYLARGGRIGKARALVGGLLGIKPILGVVEGEVAPVDRVRGGRAAHPKILEILRKRVDPKRPVVAGVSHGNAPAWADRLEKSVRDAFQVSELIQAEVGPVVGTHAGPGVVSVSLFQPEGDEAGLIAPL